MPKHLLRSLRYLALPLLLATACATGGAPARRDADLRVAVDELLAADRAFSATAGRADALSAIRAMLSDEVAMPTPRGEFARGPSAVGEVLRSTLGRPGTRARWTPIRGGISADGHQGFTFGYMTVHVPDSQAVLLKYLAYWVKRPQGWRVAAYNVRRRPSGGVSLAMIPPSLPAQSTPVRTDSAIVAHHYASLVAAERAFSDRAQIIGLGPAFVEYGRDDAVNMGGRDRPSFIFGADSIGRMIGASSPQPTSPVSWSADRAIVASSGDLGVTFGLIRPTAPHGDAARATGVPFFTIWRRPRLGDPWRYVAE